ncbi:MAG: HypC/HybG/HupF family hydrogenase formation chaperone [Clostridiales bacterium]|nr:HypC/HybG/HupF family hydrogenase formation chaperone [Clostridiales bacterium]MDD7035465.1 HypC/HybG/HupF family hydrogenase formation chaperone [Bacillota bacterium]MDY2919952.1 HypC/HybG/HupF family hydrogenase formation chaperone [Lentihominibacter sp.]
MCVAVPGCVTEIDGSTATVDFNGNTVKVNIGLVQPEVGQYVLVHAGCAIEVMEKDAAQEIIDLFSDIAELEA